MTRPPDSMQARWLDLYPEIMGAYEQDKGRLDEADRIRGLLVRPILQSRDLASAFTERREAYRGWKESLTNEATDLEVMLAHEDRLGDSLSATFEEHQDELGERAVRAIREALRLRKIVRRSVIPHRETWPQDSWHRIGRLMNDSELCLAAILEYLATGVGRRGNVETLAAWGFQYSLDAYFDAGRHGQEWTRLEDIPE